MKTTLIPLYDKILVQRCKEEAKSASGLYIPDSAKEKPSQGYVIAVGTGVRNPTTGELTPLAVKEGDKVLFGKYAGTDVKIDTEELLMMREEDVLGIIKESTLVTL